MALTTKTCKKCDGAVPLDGFHRQKSSKDGRSSFCKSCDKARTYAWRQTNPGGHAAVQARYRKAHPERVAISLKAWLAKHPEYERERMKRRMADPAQREVYRASQRNYKNRKRANSGSITTAEVREILKNPCFYCGGTATEMDHVVPVSRGGAHSRENVVPACRKCNASKAAKTPQEWEARRALGR